MSLLHLTIELFVVPIQAVLKMVGGRLKTWFALLSLLGVTVATPALAATRHHHHHGAAQPIATSTDPGLHSAAAYVIDQDDSSVWYSRNASVASPIASITKLMTALVVADARLPLDEELEVTQDD